MSVSEKGNVDPHKCAAQEGYLKIRNHIHKLALLSYCCEITSRFGQVNMPAPKLYGLLQTPSPCSILIRGLWTAVSAWI